MVLEILGNIALAVRPVLSFWKINYEEVLLKEIIIEIGFLIGLAIAILLLFYKVIFKKFDKAIFLNFIFFYMFISFEHFFDSNDSFFLFLHKYGIRYIFLIPLWVSLFSFIAFKVKKSERNFNSINKFLSYAAIILFLEPLVGLSLQKNSNLSASTNIKSQSPCILNYKPNIYYIVLDGYSRHDVLKKLHHYDNSSFLTFLRSNNFYVSEKSLTNYPYTQHSIPPTMAMQYLNITPTKQQTAQEIGYSPWQMATNSKLFSFLKENGYTIIHVSSGYGFSLYNKTADINLNVPCFSVFLPALINKTILGPLYRIILARRIIKLPSESSSHYYFLLSQFKTLTNLTNKKYQEPFFVFCHIVCPHRPFVFDKKGNFHSPESSPLKAVDQYTQNIKGLNLHIEKVISHILKNNIHPPIILINADHGSNFVYDTESNSPEAIRERMPILSAFHLPEVKDYTSVEFPITPINTWRFILNRYFNTDLPLLPEKCFWSSKKYPFLLEEKNPLEINNFKL